MTHQDPHSKATDPVQHGEPVEAQYVRGGRPGVRILWLLIISLGAVAVLLLGMWALSNGGFKATDANTGAQAVDAQAFQNGPAVPTADAPTTSTGDPTSVPTGEAPNVNAPTVTAPAQ